MSVDCRTRLYRNMRDIASDEVFDSILPEAVSKNGRLAARGKLYKELPDLSITTDRRSVTLRAEGNSLVMVDGISSSATAAEISGEGLSNLIQDRQSTMGLAMTSKVTVTQGGFDTFVAWEPVLRALLDARPVHEAGAVRFLDRGAEPLDLARSFRLDDDPEEISHFLHEAGFLHLRDVFDADEMDAVGRDLDCAISQAAPDDGASWWAGDSQGKQQAVRVLWFNEKSEALNTLLYDPRLQWLAGLTGDLRSTKKMKAEGLVKPLDIKTGLSDLPWHKDCGQGMHSYYCNSMTVGISVTGADQESGALGVVPGSHRANLPTAGYDPNNDLLPIKLETQKGDVTVHCSDTLHRAHRPTTKPRKVVYTDFPLALRGNDVMPVEPKTLARKNRAALTNVRDRISASGGEQES
jgi:hypothetical protein